MADSKDQNALINKLLQAEEEADVIVTRARENRVKKLKEASASAEADMKIFREKEEEKFREEYSEKFGKEDVSTRDLEKIVKADLETVQQDFKNNRSKVVKYLVDTVCTVDSTMSDVQIAQLKRAQ